MKKRASEIIFAIVLVVGLFTLVGCEKKKDNKEKTTSKVTTKSNFKNPKTVKLTKEDKGTTEITYENDGKIEESESDGSPILKNSEQNFRIIFEYSKTAVETAKNQVGTFKKSDSYDVIENVEFGGYKGYAVVEKKYATTQVFLYLDEKNDVLLVAKVSPVQSSKAGEAVKNAETPADVLYNLDDVQAILKTITYKK